MAHTPGKWTFFYDPEAGYQIDSKETIVATVYKVEDGEGRANANLIAAAPELLVACKIALEELQPDGIEYPIQRKALNKIGRAVRKAEGNK